MHENVVYYAIQRALKRNFRTLSKDTEGMAVIDDAVLDAMREIHEAGISFVTLKEARDSNRS